jgi:hypothetical protein
MLCYRNLKQAHWGTEKRTLSSRRSITESFIEEATLGLCFVFDVFINYLN